MIPHSRPDLGPAERRALVAVLASGHVAQGPVVEGLEEEVAAFLGGDHHRHAAATSSGTAALWAALRCLGVGDGDEVLVPGHVCASVAQAVRFAGATPCLVDCDPRTLAADPDDARRRVGRRTRACVVVHPFGLPVDPAPFRELGVPVVEDCAQTLGVGIGARRVGADGIATVCSFYATKLVAGGEGGMVVSDDVRVADRVRRLRNCDAADADADAFNVKLSDLHAAVAREQLRRLPELLRRRRDLAASYRRALADLPVELPAAPPGGEHAWFRFVVGVPVGRLDELLEATARHGLACRRPVGPPAPGLDAALADLPGCRQARETACSIPLYPALTPAEEMEVPACFRAAAREVLGDGVGPAEGRT